MNGNAWTGWQTCVCSNYTALVNVEVELLALLLHVLDVFCSKLGLGVRLLSHQPLTISDITWYELLKASFNKHRNGVVYHKTVLKRDVSFTNLLTIYCFVSGMCCHLSLSLLKTIFFFRKMSAFKIQIWQHLIYFFKLLLHHVHVVSVKSKSGTAPLSVPGKVSEQKFPVDHPSRYTSSDCVLTKWRYIEIWRHVFSVFL
jgi:hypothetical protein